MANTPYPLPRQTRESTIQVGNGTAGPYGPSQYRVFDVEDVSIYLQAEDEDSFTDVTDSCTVTKTAGEGYDTFSVTFAGPVPATSRWYHAAKRVSNRSVAVTRAGTLVSDELEKELSKQATVLSEVRRDLGRSLHIVDPIDLLPVPIPEPGKVLAGNSTGDGYVNAPMSEADIAADVEVARQQRIAAEEAAGMSGDKADLAQAWAESSEPPAGAGTESAKSAAVRASTQAAIATLQASTAAIEANRSQSEADRAALARDAAEDAVQFDYLVDDNAALNAIVGMTSGQKAFVRATEHVWHYGGAAWVDDGLAPTAQKANKTPASASVSGLMTPDMFNNLERSYKPRGSLASNANLNTIITPGTYQGIATADMVGLPEGVAIGASFYLTILPYGWLVGSGSNNRFVPQNIEMMGDRTMSWKRRLDQQNPSSTVGASAWKRVAAQWVGNVSDTDVNTLITDGLYLLTTGNTNLPIGWSAGGLLRVMSFGGGYVLHLIYNLTNPSVAFLRTMRPALGIVNPWYPTGGGSGGDFNGKLIVSTGDSITENGNYPLLLGQKLGANVINGGFGGCRMAVHNHGTIGPYYDPMSMYRISEYIRYGTWQTLIDAAQALYEYNGDDNRTNAAALAGIDWSTVDYLILFWGTNDFTAGIPIGIPDDMTAATFKGAINIIVTNIMAAYPKMKLVFITPMWRERANTPNSQGAVLKEFADAVIERAQAYQFPAFDMYRNCGINALNYLQYIPDGTHPVAGFGYQHVADKIGGFMRGAF